MTPSKHTTSEPIALATLWDHLLEEIASGGPLDETTLSVPELHLLEQLRDHLRGPVRDDDAIDWPTLFAELSKRMHEDDDAATKKSRRPRFVPRSKRWRWGLVQMALAALLGAVAVAALTQSPPPPVIQESPGVTLPDGSIVTLNPESQIDYNELAFENGVRDLTLSGTAHFKIRRDAAGPFVVHADCASSPNPRCEFVVDAIKKGSDSTPTLDVVLSANHGKIRAVGN
jgi:ferric-dicitrate binding protein FerR (iron transport regulator)